MPRSFDRLFPPCGLAALAAFTLVACGGEVAKDAAVPEPVPALWKVADADTTVYLFGTIHALPDDVVWFDGKVRDAYAAAEEVALEAIDQDDLLKVQNLTVRYGIDPDGRPLDAALDRETVERLGETLSDVGLPPSVLQPMEPWMATMTLVSAQIVAMGYDPRLGVDMVLRTRAEEAGKRLVGLENTEAQFAMLDALPRPVQVRWLQLVLAQWDEAPGTLDALAAAWNAGEVDDLAAEIRDSMDKMPELIEVMLTRRNAAFADWIVARMAEPGTVFFAVGAAHLAGDDSVQRFLREAGLRVERL